MASNIYNPTTGVYGYQSPGAALPQGFQSFQGTSPSVAATNAAGGTILGPGGSFADKSGGSTNPHDAPGYDPVTNTTTAPSAITPESVTPTSPVKLPEPTGASTTAAGVSGNTSAITDQQKIQNQIDQDAANKKAATDAQQGVVNDLVNQVSGLQTNRATAEGDATTPGTPLWLKAQADNYANLMDSSQRAQLNEKQALQASGLGQDQIRQKEAEIDNRYGLQQTDLQLKYHIASGDYNSAENTLDTKLKLALEPLNTKLTYQTQVYNNLQGRLTTAEDRQFTNMIADSKAALATAQQGQTEVKDIYQKLLETNPDALKTNPQLAADLSNAKNGTEALGILAKSGASLINPLDTTYKQMQIASLAAKNGNTVSGSAGDYQPIDLSTVQDKNAGNSTWGGLSYNGLFNAAALYNADNGKMPSLGLGQSGDVKKARTAVVNFAGQIADSLGLTTPQMSALYKADSKAASEIVSRVAKIDATSNTLANQFPRLATLADKVSNLGITEADLTAGKAKVASKFGSVDAANYVELIQTVRGDYAAMQAAIGGSRGGQFFSQTAQQAIPLGLTSDQYRGIEQTIRLSAVNSQKGTQDEANRLIGNIGTNVGNNQAPTDQSGSTDLNTQFDNLFKQYGGQ